MILRVFVCKRGRGGAVRVESDVMRERLHWAVLALNLRKGPRAKACRELGKLENARTQIPP